MTQYIYVVYDPEGVAVGMEESMELAKETASVESEVFEHNVDDYKIVKYQKCDA